MPLTRLRGASRVPPPTVLIGGRMEVVGMGIAHPRTTIGRPYGIGWGLCEDEKKEPNSSPMA